MDIDAYIKVILPDVINHVPVYIWRTFLIGTHILNIITFMCVAIF